MKKNKPELAQESIKIFNENIKEYEKLSKKKDKDLLKKGEAVIDSLQENTNKEKMKKKKRKKRMMIPNGNYLN